MTIIYDIYIVPFTEYTGNDGRVTGSIEEVCLAESLNKYPVYSILSVTESQCSSGYNEVA